MTLRALYLTPLGLLLACAPVATKPIEADDTAGETEADTDTDTDTDADADADSDADADDTGEMSLEDCEEDLVAALEWFDGSASAELLGEVELGQTQVVKVEEDRHAPLSTQERATLVLFTPTEALDADTQLRLRATLDGSVLGVLPMDDPALLPQALEEDLTDTLLEPYSDTAWSTLIPWHWMKQGVALEIGHQSEDTVHVHSLVLDNLAAPHLMTITRSKIVLFGDEGYDTSTLSAPDLVWDFFPAVPGAELQLVDSLPWVLDYFVVNTSEGPRVVTSEGHRTDITSDESRWNILKHQMALRLSTANTGRGLSTTTGSAGDSSPYSFGTSLALGWVMNDDGSYSDIDNAGLAAGWTGWTGLWVDECGNGFIHELGHSFSLLHFTTGTAIGWGIGDEYPYDGRHIGANPTGYDTLRNQFRTWYRVDAAGPVYEGDYMRGKDDPMNGGEAANAQTCFPQYTPYHAQKIQDWATDTATITSVDGAPGLYAWNAGINAYYPQPTDPSNQTPIAIGVPTATLIGTMGNVAEADQTYPPIYSISGNVFDLPDPLDPDLADVFNGAQYLVEITYADASLEQALIAVGEVTSTSLRVYSLNLDLRREPRQVDLLFSPSGYPDIDLEALELRHSLVLDPPELEDLPPLVRAGRGHMANGALRLFLRCEPGLNCVDRRVESHWRQREQQIRFRDTAGETGARDVCTEVDGFTVLHLPVVDEAGTEAELVVHAQRVLHTPGQEVATALHDMTPWIDAPDLTQSLRVWIPWEENIDLGAGTWTNASAYLIEGVAGGEVVSQTPIEVDLTVYEHTAVDLSEDYYSPGYSSEGSSFYYVLTDASIGPTTRVWWGGTEPTPLSVPVLDDLTGEATRMAVNSWKIACGDRWELNSGQSADWLCDHSVVLAMDETGNDHLEAGHLYQTAPSAPVLIEGRRWHAPDAMALIHSFAFEIEYTVPE